MMTGPVQPSRRRRNKKSSPVIAVIQRAMDAKGLSQSDLAKAAGFNKSTISRILSGSAISLDRAERISTVLGIPLEELTPEKDRSFVSSTALIDGTVRFQANLIVPSGVDVALEAIAAFEKPISSERLLHLLSALHDPLP